VEISKLPIANQFIYATVKISGFNRGSLVSTGTGFLFAFAPDENGAILSVVTNKHVIKDIEEISITLHVGIDGFPSGETIECRLENFPDLITMHPSEEIDLCAFPISLFADQAAANGKNLILPALHEDLIPTSEEWRSFDAIENIKMIGCPNGIYDDTNKIAIVRSGITATPLFNNYNDKSEFMVDIACFPGSSGSPVIILDKIYNSINGKMDAISRHYLVGILYAGPTIENEGELGLSSTARIITRTMMHLGNVIKSSELKIIGTEMARRRALGH
jgi:hypothetical protein